MGSLIKISKSHPKDLRSRKNWRRYSSFSAISRVKLPNLQVWPNSSTFRPFNPHWQNTTMCPKNQKKCPIIPRFLPESLIPGQLKASFLIFLTLGLIKQSNTPSVSHALARTQEGSSIAFRVQQHPVNLLDAVAKALRLFVCSSRCFWLFVCLYGYFVLPTTNPRLCFAKTWICESLPWKKFCRLFST